jgi:site-specific DNA-methyltransferase (adenine-specific)
LEPDFRDYIKHLVQIFAECHRVLKKTGTLWVNIADSYAGARNSNRNGATESLGGKVRGGGKFVIDKLLPKDIKLKQKSLMNIPARLAIVMTDELGFIQRNWCNWWKRSTMPSSAKDRFTIDNETVFFFTKSKKYYFEQQLEKAQTIQPRVTKMLHDSETNISVPYNRAGNTVIEGDDSQRNIRTTWDTYELNFEWPSETPSTTTWNVNTANGEKREVQHFAAFPTDLTERMIKAGCPVGGIVYDPFMGTGSTAVCAWRLGRSYIGSELLENYYIGSLKRLDELKAPGGIPQERLFR